MVEASVNDLHCANKQFQQVFRPGVKIGKFISSQRVKQKGGLMAYGLTKYSLLSSRYFSVEEVNANESKRCSMSCNRLNFVAIFLTFIFKN